MATIESNPSQPATEPSSAADRTSSELPSPNDFPEADVVVYDGNCVFCSNQVKNLMRLDGKNRLTFISLHDEFVAQQFSDLGYDQLMEQIYLIPAEKGKDGYTTQRLGGAAAIRYLTRRLPKLWIMAPLMHIPFAMPIWQWGYAQIAKRRYKIAGKSGTQCDENGSCALHFKE